MSKDPQIRKDHNGGLTPEIVAKYVRQMAAADKIILDGQAKLKAAKTAAKDDGVPIKELLQALADMKLDPQVVIDRENRRISMLKMLRAPLGTQFSFLDDAGDTLGLTEAERNKRWHNEGYQAGLQGKNRDENPHDPNAEAGRAWNEGYAEGQGENLAKITDGKGNKAEAAKPGRKPRGTKATDPVAAPTPDPEPDEETEEDGADDGAVTASSGAPVPPGEDFDSGGKLQTTH